ncbi:hypothetical protein [Bacillus sp. JCM 19041]|uniref:hypothetical protein n=1 Tax=Bacillus sp. JCM 19041 TaxID=1460637 RepID=UPI000B0CF371
MKSYHTFRQQRNKWSSGTLDLLLNTSLAVKTNQHWRMWISQLRSFLNLFIRILLILLLSTALITDQFTWHWLWFIPIILAAYLNLLLAIKTPMRRPIDVILSGTLISPEIYLWANSGTFLQVWLDKLSKNKKDGWSNQYNAENGQTRSRLTEGIALVVLLVCIIIFCAVYFRDYFTSPDVQQLVHPYLQLSWIIFTYFYLTIIASLMMLHHIWTLRRNHKA